MTKTTSPAPTIPDHAETTDGPVVLVAEDDSVQRLAVTRLLEREGYRVLAAENGASAIALADAHEPDLLLIDAVMPQMGGFEAIAAIRSRPGMTTTPAIVLSGLEDIESRVNALAIGADDFVLKPYDHRELVARVQAQLRIVDAWYGRVNSMMYSFRVIRRRINESERASTPAEAARLLIPYFPTELGCSTLVTVDAYGDRQWATEPFYREDFDELDLTQLDLDTRGRRLETNDRGICPLCGAGTGGVVLATPAGSWTNGRAVLLVGCVDRTDEDLSALADEVAEACDVVLSERMRTWESDLELDAWFRRVVEERAFEIVYQPIVDMRSCRVVAQEALARFDDGTAPGEVFRAAVALDRRVELELALAGKAIEQAVALPDGIRLHVNVSPATALTAELRELVEGSSRRVVLEITEDALFSAASADALRTSIPASCLLAADDVGAGCAGLSQILEYRPDMVKIDRAVVKGINLDPARQALVAGLVQFAQATRSFVVGEGVECDEEWQTLRRLGVDFGQGYLFSRPVRLAAAARMSHCRDREPVQAPRKSLRHLISS